MAGPVSPIVVLRPTVDDLKRAADDARSESSSAQPTRAATPGGAFDALVQATSEASKQEIIVCSVKRQTFRAYKFGLLAATSISLDALRRLGPSEDRPATILQQWCRCMGVETWAVFCWDQVDNRVICVRNGARTDDSILQTQSWDREFVKDCLFSDAPVRVSSVRSPDLPQDPYHHRYVAAIGAPLDPVGRAAERVVRLVFIGSEFRYALVLVPGRLDSGLEPQDFYLAHRQLLGLMQQTAVGTSGLLRRQPNAPTSPGRFINTAMKIAEAPPERRLDDLREAMQEVFDHRRSAQSCRVSVFKHGGDTAPVGSWEKVSHPKSGPNGACEHVVRRSITEGRSIAIADLSEVQDLRSGGADKQIAGSAVAASLLVGRADRKRLSSDLCKDLCKHLDSLSLSCMFTEVANRAEEVRLCEDMLLAYRQMQILATWARVDQTAADCWKSLLELDFASIRSHELMKVACEHIRKLANAELCYFLRRDHLTRHFRTHAIAIDNIKVPRVIKKAYGMKSGHLHERYVGDLLRYRLLPRRFGRTAEILETGERELGSIPNGSEGESTYDQIRCFPDYLGFPFATDLSPRGHGVIWLRWMAIIPGGSTADREKALDELSLRLLKGAVRAFLEAVACMFSLLWRLECTDDSRAEPVG